MQQNQKEAIQKLINTMKTDIESLYKDGEVGLLVKNLTFAHINAVQSILDLVEISKPEQDQKLFEERTKNVIQKRAQQHNEQMEYLSRMEERGGPVMCMLNGGKSDGTVVSFESQPPPGAKTMQGGEIYVMKNGQFHYSEE